MAFLQPGAPTSLTMDTPSSSSHPPSTPLSRVTSAFNTRRARKQASLFVFGATFFFFSGIITRRSLHHRYLASIPKRFTPSNEAPTNFSGPGEAVEALTIATVNVTSFALMLTGGTLWAFDISTMADLRKRIRGGLGTDRDEQQAEEEFEEWIASTLARKEHRAEAKRRVEGGGEEGRTNERGKDR